jgi:hypothetical protein
MIKDPLRQLDLDYYRSMLLHAVRAELERLRQERSAATGLETCSTSLEAQTVARVRGE